MNPLLPTVSRWPPSHGTPYAVPEGSAGDPPPACDHPCGRALPCGEHPCPQRCHAGPCTKLDRCTVPCGRPLPCGHACAKPCHPGKPCPPVCKAEVEAHCPESLTPPQFWGVCEANLNIQTPSSLLWQYNCRYLANYQHRLHGICVLYLFFLFIILVYLLFLIDFSRWLSPPALPSLLKEES